MSGLFVDTSAWWHWFSYTAGKSIENETLRAEAAAFGELYSFALSKANQPFLYNARIPLELPHWLREDFDRLVKPHARFIPIPLSRCDSAYKADGSILHGGRMGGTLACVLSMDSYEHEKRLKEASLSHQHGHLYESHERRREFDVEHLESALEADANIFVTTDISRIKWIERAVELWPESEAVVAAARLCKIPSAALALLKEDRE